MDITDADGKWRIRTGSIENRETGEVRQLKETPKAGTLAYMSYDKFMRKCQVAFNTGVWPKSYWSSGRVTD